MNNIDGDIRQTANTVGGSAAQLGNMAVGANAAEAARNVDMAVLHTLYARLRDTLEFTGSFAEWLQVLADGRPVEFSVVDGAIAWRYADAVDWTSLVPLTDLVGAQGPSVELNNDGTFLRWRVAGTDGPWINIVALADLVGSAGADGREVVFGTTATHVVWKYADDVNWIDLLALSSLVGAAGADGKQVELTTDATHVLWRYTDEAWTQLIALSAITGPQGWAGPNTVSTNTSTNISGLLKGADGLVAQATAGMDYFAPVNGALLVGDGAVSAPSVSFTNDPDTGWYSGGANILKAATGGVDRITIGSDGKVGIGADPSTGAHVLNVGGGFKVGMSGGEWFSVASGTVVFNSQGGTCNIGAGSTTFGARINIAPISDSAPLLSMRGSATQDIIRISSPAAITGDYAIIKADGKVGVGTTSPKTPFHTAAGTPGITYTPNVRTVATFENAGNFGSAIAITALSAKTANIWFGTQGNETSGQITFDSSTNAFSFYNNGATRLTLNNSGNLGIGTVTPAYPLDVKGSTSDNAIITRFYGDTSTIGSLGIANRLAGSPGMRIGTIGGSESLGLMTVNTERVTIRADGNVGIGTTSPTERLDVSGNIEASGTITAGGNLLVNGSIVYINTQQALTQGVNSLTLGQSTYFTTLTYGNGSTLNHKFVAGNVGIGTATPSAKVHARATTEQLRLGYDDSNYISVTVGSTGGATFSNAGAATDVWTYNGNVVMNGTANRMPNQVAATSDAVMTRVRTWDQFLNPCIRTFTPTSGQTRGGGSSVVTTNGDVSLYFTSATNAAAIGIVALNVHTYAGATGTAMNYTKPLLTRIRAQIYPQTAGLTKFRVLAGVLHNTNTVMTAAEADPLAAYQRAYGFEVRRLGGAGVLTHEARLFARNAWNTNSYAAASITNGSPIVTNVNAAQATEIQTRMAAGDTVLITGTGIPAGAYVVSVDSATQITLSANATQNYTFGSAALVSKFPGTLEMSAWVPLNDPSVGADRFYDFLLGHGGTSGKIGLWASSWWHGTTCPTSRPVAPLVTLTTALNDYKTHETFAGSIVAGLVGISSGAATGQALLGQTTIIESLEPIGTILS